MEIEELRDVVRKIVLVIVSRKAELGRTFVFEEDDTRSQGGVPFYIYGARRCR
jgi:hypothetical protein